MTQRNDVYDPAIPIELTELAKRARVLLERFGPYYTGLEFRIDGNGAHAYIKSSIGNYSDHTIGLNSRVVRGEV